jgi:hypothetical protein
MWLKALVGFFVVLFGVMYWQSPNGQRDVFDGIGQTHDEWQKLKQQIRAHRKYFTATTTSRRDDVQRNVEHASAPQLTESYAVTDAAPVQEDVVETPAKAQGPNTNNVDGARTRAEPRKRLTSREKRLGPKRLVRITTYEGGRPVRVRTFEAGPAPHGGPPHRRYYVACPGGKCRPLTAAMFGPDGEFN